MTEVLLFNKPFRVLSQFTDESDRATLANYLQAPGFRAAGRLDYDSEGLLVLTADGRLQQHIANPRHKLDKRYLVQVEGAITDDALASLRAGVTLKDGPTRPAMAKRVEAPALWDRIPPIRERQHIPVSWLELTINEGRNRQVRRMTASVGFPTLRLIRTAVGPWTLDDMAPGAYRYAPVPAQLVPNRPPQTGQHRGAAHERPRGHRRPGNNAPKHRNRKR